MEDSLRYGKPNYRNKPKYIVIHHNAGFGHETAETIDRLHTIERAKEGKRPWACIGYHYVILPSGQAEAGRYEKMNGSHAPGMNRRSLGVCFIGNFETGKPPSKKQLKGGARLVAELCSRFSILPADIIPHHTVYRKYWNPYHKRKRHTKCPGRFFPIGDFRRMVRDLLASDRPLVMEEV
jgi:hypothetical protein